MINKSEKKNKKERKAVEVLFLGTSACDFSEKLKTDYKDCFDDNARRSSAVLLDKRVLIDCGPHTLNALKIAGVDKNQITDLILTHLHDDHFDKENVQRLAKNRENPLRVWVRAGADICVPEAEIIKMPLYKKLEGSGFFVTGLHANHDENACPQHLFLEIDGKKIFYGCDGGWFLNKTYEFLRENPADVAVLDCTVGDKVGDYRAFEHNSLSMLRVLLPSLKTIGFVTDKTKVYLSHLAPSLHLSHEETCLLAKDIGVVAFDGLKINL